MRAVAVNEDQRLSWEEVPDPVVGLEDVLLRVHATAVNRADLLQRRGLYPPPPGAPPWMGLEASGVVIGVGSSAGWWQVGDRACALLPGGGYAEKVAVHRDLLLPIPRGLSLIQAAALPEVFATAYLNLLVEGRLAAGETVLIHAGASGVGTAAIQLAKDRGARVITTVGTAEKAGRVRALGADRVIQYRVEDVTAQVREIAAAARPGTLSPRGGIDVVLDSLGGEELATHLPLLNEGGRWVIIALIKGGKVNLDLRPLLSRRLRLIGSTLRGRPVAEKALILAGLRREVWPRLEGGAIHPVIHETIPIDEAERAHAILERNENIGKVVLTVPQQGE